MGRRDAVTRIRVVLRKCLFALVVLVVKLGVDNFQISRARDFIVIRDNDEPGTNMV